MIDGGLIAAGRALAGKNQKDLAQMAQVSLDTLADVEAGRSNPTQKTENKILQALAQCGVEIRDGAVRRIHDMLRIIEGDDCYLRLLDDVAASGADELLVFYGDDSLSPPAVIERYRALRANGVRMRQLVKEGDQYLMGALHEYRSVPPEFFVNRVGLVYGDNYAFVHKGGAKRVIINRDAQLAAQQRSQFMLIWSQAKQPKESHATEKF